MPFSRLFAMPKFSCRSPFDKSFAKHAGTRAFRCGIAVVRYPVSLPNRNHHNGYCRRLSFIQALYIGLLSGTVTVFHGI